MKQAFSVLIVSVATLLPILGQNIGEVPVGFINAVGLTAKTDFKIDGRPLKPAGFATGAYASGFAVSSGTHQFTFSNAGADTVARNVSVTPGASPLYVLYKGIVKQGNGAPKNVLKVAEIPPQAVTTGPQFFAFSTLEGRLATFQANGVPLSLEPLKVIPIPGAALTVESAGAKPLHATPREKGNYVLVLFDGVDSRLHWSLVEMTR
jgi:hypothetical protein